MLIRNADIWQQGPGDVRVDGGTITAIGSLTPAPGEAVIDADGGLLIPGLHDHHIHLAALAVSRASIFCGPPQVMDETALARALARPGTGWLRAVGYHESVAGMLDAAQLDRLAPDRPIRIQHRSGRMWFFNSLALDLLLKQAPPPPGLERIAGQWSGRLFDEDAWLRTALPSQPPCFAAISATLAQMGVTGITDMSPGNDPVMAAHFTREQKAGRLMQNCVLAGRLDLAEAAFGDRLELGSFKLHLHDAALPDFDETVTSLCAAHEQGRGVATHCTTEGELVFALAALDIAGTAAGDRIEHGGIAPDHLVAEMQRMNLRIVSQPHFIAERGDQYLRDVPMRDHRFLYRLAAFHRAGLVLAGGSDAPFGSCDPWAAMRAAVARRTAAGAVIEETEALSPEQALTLYLGDPHCLEKQRGIAIGQRADLCLLDRSWARARSRLLAEDVRLTMIGGSIVHDRVNQAPVERDIGADPAA